MTLPAHWVHSPRRLALPLAAAALGLVLAHVTVMFVYYEDLFDWRSRGLSFWHIAIFDLDEEESFGTWFSSLLLFGAGLLTWLHARSQPGIARWRAWWVALALGFCLLSLDEVVGLHEYSNSLMEEDVWTTWGMVVAGVVGLLYLPVLWSLRWRTGVLFALAGAIYLGGAVGVEHATEWYAEQSLLNTLPYNLWTAVEEGLEMAGPILYIYALLDHARRQSP